MGHLNSGDLNQQVVLLTPGGVVSDGQGGVVPTVAGTRRQVSARVRPLRGGEKLALGQTLASEAYELTIRYQATASAAQRVEWRGKILDVQQVLPDEFREYQLLTCFYRG